jgi:BirA family biotin operon repressor/biotin-[acetyl-CoA-carboxylase] ligase
MSSAFLGREWPVVHFDEIDSTNEEAQRRARFGETGPVWLHADLQTAGRGRMGRRWASPIGNLCATALFVWPETPAKTALISFAAAVALHEAIASLNVEVRSLSVKWPNDLMAGGAKIAGILIETGATRDGLWVAAGFGVNIASAPQVPDRTTARLCDFPGGRDVDPAALLSSLDARFRFWLGVLAQTGFEPVREAWKDRAAGLGERIALSPASGGGEGVFLDLAADGALVLQDASGELRHIRAGEISVLQ